MSAMDAQGPGVRQGRLSASSGDANGCLACLDKTQRSHEKTLVCADQG